jgi:hypothetical protein
MRFSTEEGPNRAARASAALPVISSRRPGARASISPRRGVPWQSPVAGSRGEAARLTF